ncbi:hypothetical protein SDJN02_20266, partial [Cucurbita argyrosperma subsp. argyrosperma]
MGSNNTDLCFCNHLIHIAFQFGDSESLSEESELFLADGVIHIEHNARAESWDIKLVKTAPSSGYSFLNITIGPLRKRTNPPTRGKPLTVGGARLLDLEFRTAEMTLARSKVATTRRPTLRNLLSGSIKDSRTGIEIQRETETEN